MRKFSVLFFAIVAVLAMPVAAGAATYPATLTVNLVDEGVVHTFNVNVDCVTGAYSGNGENNYNSTGHEAVTGNLSTSSLTGHAIYGPGSTPNPYFWDFGLISGDGGVTYTGTGTSSAGETFAHLTGTVSGSRTAGCVASTSDQCKKGGWESRYRADYTTFKNQGDCVSYTQNGK
jgi:hypothetical protein